MAARLAPTAPMAQRLKPPLDSLVALFAAIPLAVMSLAVISTPVHAGGDGMGSLPLPDAATAAQRQLHVDAPTLSRSYPAPVRQAYPYPSNPVPQSLPLGQPAAFPMIRDPLVVCPATMLTFLNNSSHRAVPLWVAARSCNCYSQERAEGVSQDLSSRRCFP